MGSRFAELLVTLAENAVADPRLPATVGMSGNSHGLERRIRRLLNKEINPMTRVNRTTLVLMVIFGLTVATFASLANVGTAQEKPALKPEARARGSQPPALQGEQPPAAKPGEGKGGKKPAPNPLFELYRKRGQLLSQSGKARIRILKSKELSDLQKTIDEADKAYNEESTKRTTTAKEAEAKAKEAMEQLQAERIAADPELTKAKQTTQELPGQKADAEYRLALANFKLTHPQSPYRRALAQDENISKLRREMYKSPRARKTYEDARRAKVEAVPGGKEVLDEAGQARAELDRINKELRDAQFKLSKAMRDSKDKELREAQNNYNAARRATYLVHGSKEMKTLGKARTDARNALQKKREELLNTDKELLDLQQQMKDVDQQIADLRAKRRAGNETKPEGR